MRTIGSKTGTVEGDKQTTEMLITNDEYNDMRENIGEESRIYTIENLYHKSERRENIKKFSIILSICKIMWK